MVEEFIDLVLYLARAFRQFSFIIRFKNLNIFDCTALEECVKTIEKSANVEISVDYSEPGLSYKLINSAFGCIGHHTSIGDEALRCGVPFIFYDNVKYAENLYFHLVPEYSELFAFDKVAMKKLFETKIINKSLGDTDSKA